MLCKNYISFRTLFSRKTKLQYTFLSEEDLINSAFCSLNFFEIFVVYILHVVHLQYILHLLLEEARLNPGVDKRANAYYREYTVNKSGFPPCFHVSRLFQVRYLDVNFPEEREYWRLLL